MVASVMVLLGFGLVLRPTKHEFEAEVWEDWRKRLPLVGVIIIYSVFLPYTGFLGAMIAMMIVVANFSSKLEASRPLLGHPLSSAYYSLTTCWGFPSVVASGNRARRKHRIHSTTF